MGAREDRQRVRFEAFVDPVQADAVVELLEAFGAQPAAPRALHSPTPEVIEEACEVMHDAYERAAVGAGWETNPASRKPWDGVPEANKVTMRAAVDALLQHVAPAPAEARGQLTRELVEHTSRTFIGAGNNIAKAVWPNEEPANWDGLSDEEKAIVTEAMTAVLLDLGWEH